MPEHPSVHIPVEEKKKTKSAPIFVSHLNYFKVAELSTEHREHAILRNIFIPSCGGEMPEGSKGAFYHAYVPPI